MLSKSPILPIAVGMMMIHQAFAQESINDSFVDHSLQRIKDSPSVSDRFSQSANLSSSLPQSSFLLKASVWRRSSGSKVAEQNARPEDYLPMNVIVPPPPLSPNQPQNSRYAQPPAPPTTNTPNGLFVMLHNVIEGYNHP